MVIFRYWKALALSLPFLLGGVVFASQLGGTVTFRGEIGYQGEGSCRGMVSLWPAEGRSAPKLERSSLAPTWFDEIDTECQFEIKAPPGSYYLQAVVRQTPGVVLGPVRENDLVFTSDTTDGETLQVSGNAGDQIHLGTLAKSNAFAGFSEHVETGITGRLIDNKGMPVEGLSVLAFSDAGMLSGLYAVSPPSDDNGRFRLHLVDKAELYLQAREELGTGLPPLGSLIGVYGEKAATPIKVEQGRRVEGVEIVVTPRKAEKTADKQ